jgi:charged multivesicular body protein 6
VLKDLQRELSMDAIENILADTAEAIAYQNELSSLLSTRLNESEMEEVEAEYERIAGQLISDRSPSVPVDAGNMTARKEKDTARSRILAE